MADLSLKQLDDYISNWRGLISEGEFDNGITDSVKFEQMGVLKDVMTCLRELNDFRQNMLSDEMEYSDVEVLLPLYGDE